MPNPIREPKVGVVSIERPFREGYLNPRLRYELDEYTLAGYIGFHNEAEANDDTKEFPNGRDKRRRRKAYR